MPNQVFEAARTIMAVREYQDKEVPEEAIRRIVEAAHLTASAANRQPWHFVLVRKREALRKLGSLVRTGPYTANAAAAVIVAYEKGSKSGVSDASRAIQSMMLVAWGDGVGSNWTGLTGLENVRQEFRLSDTKGDRQEKAQPVRSGGVSGALRQPPLVHAAKARQRDLVERQDALRQLEPAVHQLG